MREVTFTEIQAMENGELIPRFTGTIRKVMDQRSGEGQYGTWTLQTVFVGNGGEEDLAVTWTGSDPFTASQEGQTYAFECGTDRNGKLVGITRDIRAKDGKTYSGIKVTPAAKIKQLIGEAHETERTEQEAPPEAPVQAPTSPVVKPNGSDWGKIAGYAKYSRKVFQSAWEEATVTMQTLMPEKDAQSMGIEAWYDLQMRIAQHIAIETTKIIRRERF